MGNGTVTIEPGVETIADPAVGHSLQPARVVEQTVAAAGFRPAGHSPQFRGRIEQPAAQCFLTKGYRGHRFPDFLFLPEHFIHQTDNWQAGVRATTRGCIMLVANTLADRVYIRIPAQYQPEVMRATDRSISTTSLRRRSIRSRRMVPRRLHPHLTKQRKRMRKMVKGIFRMAGE